MAYTEKRIIQGSALTTSFVDYYTVPVLTVTAVKQIVLCNTDSIVRTVTLHVTPNTGTTPGVADILFSVLSISPNETKIIGLTDILQSGNTIKAKASFDGVVAINASGVERT